MDRLLLCSFPQVSNISSTFQINLTFNFQSILGGFTTKYRKYQKKMPFIHLNLEKWIVLNIRYSYFILLEYRKYRSDNNMNSPLLTHNDWFTVSFLGSTWRLCHSIWWLIEKNCRQICGAYIPCIQGQDVWQIYTVPF